MRAGHVSCQFGRPGPPASLSLSLVHHEPTSCNYRINSVDYADAGCSSRAPQFSYDRKLWQWEARTLISASPFSTSTVKVQIVGDEKPLRPDQLALAQRVIAWLPELMPQITKQLAEYDEDLKDPKILREQLTEPSICLFEPEEQPSRSWFTHR